MHSVQTREVTDKFTVEVEMDRRCYEQLLDERKNMELTYEERIAQLQDQHAEVGLTWTAMVGHPPKGLDVVRARLPFFAPFRFVSFRVPAFPVLAADTRVVVTSCQSPGQSCYCGRFSVFVRRAPLPSLNDGLAYAESRKAMVVSW